MQISGIIEKVYDYDFGTGDISMDILSDGKVIRCTGISGRFQAGHPVIIEGILENNTFMFHNINMDYSNAAALKKLVPNTQLPDIKDLNKIKNLDRKIISSAFLPQLEQNLYNKYRDDLSFTQIRNMVSKGVYEIPENPYSVCAICGFKLTDKVAAKRGVSVTNKARLNALVNSAIDRLAENGDTYISIEQIASQISGFQQAYPKLDTRYILMNANVNKKYILTGNGYAVQQRILAEKNVARQYARLENSKKNLSFDKKMVDEIEAKAGIKYAPQQRGAFDMCSSTGLKILTGGPGTGKTSTLKGILEALSIIMPDAVIKCCAPTGRAAQRMKEATGLESLTVHRLCEYRPFDNESYSSKNETDPIEADIIVVDEVSMLDINLASMLLSAIKDGSFVLFVGDINQLESVGPGSVLRDLIASGKVPVYQLTKVYRQSEDSQIVANANKVKDGNMDIKDAEDFKVIKCVNEADVATETMKIFKKYYDRENPYDFQVLSPIKASLAGVNHINELAQDDIYSESNTKYITVSRKKYHVGEKIIFLQNEPSRGFYNGDCGVITEISGNDIIIDIPGENIVLSKEDFSCLKLAYDITIHKSQGSEYPVIAIPLVKRTPGMLTRNLLYTAITRAKKMVYIISEDDSMEMCIKHVTSGRKTGLVAEIISALN